MTTDEQRRALILNRVLAGEWSQQEAATILGLSERHIRRLLTRYRACGPVALVHGNRGRAPAHRLPQPVRDRIVALATGKYAGCNHQHLTEKLREAEGIAVSRMTVHRLLREAGQGSPRPRRAPKHRQRRERMAQEGMLLQADGSRHQWLGADGPYLTLLGGIDDATGTVPWALFRAQEDVQGYLLWLQQVVLTQGIPQALYVDRHGIFERSRREPLTLEEELAGGPLPTQFGRVLQELGITLVLARSPQAKGRIERLWGTFQDRFVNELRLAGATTLDAANRVLWAWLPQFNARFAVPAASSERAYRPLPPDFAPERICCFKYARTVAADNTVRLGEHRLQLQPGRTRRSFAKAQVEVHERLDGSLAVYHQGQEIAVQPAPLEAPVLRARTGKRVTVSAPPSLPASSTQAGGAQTPAPDHPWRRAFTSTARTKSLST